MRVARKALLRHGIFAIQGPGRAHHENYVAAGCGDFERRSVQAAAANTRQFATTTGMAPINAPYTIHNAAPAICTARNSAGRRKKYDPTNSVVATQPRISVATIKPPPRAT
jgi:hypothetical protein